MSKLTKSLESATRKKIDQILINLGWEIDEESPQCNVFTERAKTKEQNNKLKGKKPDYILYKRGTNIPITIIEAKKKGESLNQALTQAIKRYAKPLNIPIVFAYDSTFVKSYDIRNKKELTIDGEALTELTSEEKLLRFIKEGPEIQEVTPKVKHTREELIKIFKWANDLLRKEGLRNLDRFIEFSNLLFIKIISEIEEDREKNGLPRRLSKDLCWESFANMEDGSTMLNYINNTVLKRGLAREYNRSDDIFQEKLKIENPNTVREIVQKLSELELLNTESEIKGDAFEYFLKSLAAGNDLGEYFTPRHIVKMMVKLVAPRYGNTVFDPFCGTGGFLIEAFRYMKKNVDEKNSKVMNKLKENSLFGIELTDTYKIAKMNMIITGDGHNNIIREDTAKNEYWQHSEISKVFKKLNIKGFDIILANLPYGMTTDYGHLYPIPSNQGDSIFIQHMILALNEGGVCAVIVPEGLLFKREHEKLRKYLLKTCEMQAVISLPQGVFLPYANVKTDILVFKKGKATTKVWFYKIENDGFELNTKRRRSSYNDIPDLSEKWEEKPKSENSFWVDVENIKENAYALNLNSYTLAEDKKSIKYEMKALREACEEIKSGGTPSRTNPKFWKGDIKWVTIGDLTKQTITSTKEKITERGLKEISAKLLPQGTILISIFATLGEVAILGSEATTNQAIVGLIPKPNTINNKFLYYVLKSKKDYIKSLGRGVAQNNINLSILKDIKIPVPSMDVQTSLVEELEEQNKIKENAEKTLKSLELAGINEIFFDSKETVKFTELVNINPQRRLTKNSYKYFVDMSSIDELTGEIKDFRTRNNISPGLSRFRENDILYARITPCTENGKVALTKGLDNETGIGSTEFIVLSPKRDLHPKWLYFFFKTPNLKEKAVASMKGTTGRQRVPKSFFEKLKLPKVELDEQIRVADELESYIEIKKNLRNIITLEENTIQEIISKLYR